MLEAGINDLRAGRSPAQTDGYLRSWIANARSAEPGVTIVVSSILDATDSARPWLPQRIRDYRALQATTVRELSTPQSRIVLADTDRGWGVVADTYDNLHPTPTGETLIAQRIAETFTVPRRAPPAAEHLPHDRLGPDRPRPGAGRRPARGAHLGPAGHQRREDQEPPGRQALEDQQAEPERVDGHRAAAPGRYQFKIKYIRARMMTDYGPPVQVVVRRGRSHKH